MKLIRFEGKEHFKYGRQAKIFLLSIEWIILGTFSIKNNDGWTRKGFNPNRQKMPRQIKLKKFELE